MAIGASKFNLGCTKRVKSTQVTQASSTSPTTRGRRRAKGHGNIVKTYLRKGKRPIVEEEEDWEESEEESFS